ncbi:MAG: phenylalanine--tRNA ligase subunit beta [Patescibacteria group bacterium]
MKVSRTWLQNYFDTELPSTEVIADALTFHAVEIEEVEGDMLDVKILPDRAAYMLCHRGVAVEVAASLNLPLTEDPLRTDVSEQPKTDRVVVEVEDAALCPRYMAALIEGVKVGPSPDWLKGALEAVGQRSINNVVDATNYVMLNIGQPLHAFDAGKLSAKDGRYLIGVRGAFEGERITTLSKDEYILPEGTLLITDRNADVALGIAGIKGGKAAEVDASTTNLIVEAASFDGTQVRKTAQALKLFTDASQRFQNKPSPALVAYGMRDVIALITEIAGGTLVGVTDVYTPEADVTAVEVSLTKINTLLGATYSAEDVKGALNRLSFSYTEADDVFAVLPSFERRDLVIAEDLVEEVGRILGYEHIPSIELPTQSQAPDQRRYRGIERIKDFLTERGYSEVSTQSFAKEGEVALANPLQEDRPWLRASLLTNLEDSLTRAAQMAPRLAGPDKDVRLFDLGNVFTGDGEFLVLALGVRPLVGKFDADLIKDHVAALEQDLFAEPVKARYALDASMVEINLSEVNLEKLGEDYALAAPKLGAYKPFSQYPFALRDIAVWTPEGTGESAVANTILSEAGDLLVRIDLFDEFTKDGRTSYAFRLVFESMDRTLSDADLDPAMERVTTALNAVEGFTVR